MKRRDFLIGSAAAALSYGAPAFAANGPSLGEIAATKGVTFGSMVKARYLQKDKRYIAMMKREIKLASCFSMQWAYVEKERGKRDYSRGDQEVDWAEAAEKACSAGFLVWDDQLPKWFEALGSGAESEKAIREHVAETCGHFGRKVQLWQVGNEALKPKDLRPDGLAKNVLIDKLGIEYLDIAFHAAKEAAPHAALLYNDGLLEYDTPDGVARRRAMLNLIDGLLKRGVPITTVGTHGHLFTQWNDKFSEKTIEGFFKEISDRGLDIAITELDVGDAGSPADFKQRDADVAATYKRYLDVALANPRLKTVIMWSLTDKDSWVVRGDIKLFARKDGLKPRPMPFDANYDTRPAYAAIAEALAAAPARAT